MIAGATLLAYLPSVNGGFILDDDLYVTGSPLINASDGLYRFWFTTEPVDYWPLTNTSFWIEWRLWGMNPTGYHVTNLVLHITSALLIWTILRKLSIPGAWLAALLFAVHPVNVESVAWIAQRKNTLSMLFFLLSILWYLKTDRGVGRWYALSLLAFTLAMLSKGSVAILPLVLLLIAWWQRGKIVKGDFLRTAPFFVVAIVLAAVNVWFQTHGADIEVRSAGFAERLAGAGAVVWFYLYKALAPLNLAFIYPQWEIQAGDWRWWLPLAAALVVTALLLWKCHNRYGRALLFAWLFFCVALLPVLGFTDVGFMKHSLVADHYQHIAIIGVIALVAAGLSLLYQHAQGAARSVRLWRIAAAALVAVLLTFLSWQQSSLYADPVTLYEAVLVKNPGSCLVHYNLGTTFGHRGRSAEAIEHYRQALKLKADLPDVENNLGVELTRIGQTQEGIQHLEQALRLKPDFVDAHNNLGAELANLGRREEAISHFEEALRLKSDSPEVHNNFGDALIQAGRLDEAIKHFQQALRLKPDYTEAHYNLGNALVQTGNIPQAIEHYRQAVRLRPNVPDIHSRLGAALKQAGRLQEAIEHYRQAVRLRPDSARLCANLGRALLEAGQTQEAIDRLEQALRLRSEMLDVAADLATAYAQMNRSADAIAMAQRAIELARSKGDTNATQQIQAWLESYRAELSNQ